MTKFLKYLFAFSVCFLATTTSTLADDNFLGGIARGQLSSDFTSNTAGSAAFEAGARNYRVSGTVGWEMNPCNRVKLTGEWLWQDIDYNFFTNTTRQWMNQTAVGAGYQFVLNNPIFNYLDITGYYSHAPSKNLIGVDFKQQSTGLFQQLFRHIAGSNAGGISPSVYFHPWAGAEGNLAANWDKVVYENEFSNHKTAKGWGGTASLTQAFHTLGENFELGGTAAIRAPFNNYRAELDWLNPYPTSQLLVGLFGEFTQGKDSLPNTSLVGVNVSYAMDTPAPRGARGVRSNSLLAYVSDPAVYMPQVLAIAEQAINICPQGSGPAFRGMIPTLSTTGAGGNAALPFDASHLFTGNNLTFTLLNAPGYSISPAGVITATPGIATVTGAIVVASGTCGPSAMSNGFEIVGSAG